MRADSDPPSKPYNYVGVVIDGTSHSTNALDDDEDVLDDLDEPEEFLVQHSIDDSKQQQQQQIEEDDVGTGTMDDAEDIEKCNLRLYYGVRESKSDFLILKNSLLVVFDCCRN